MYNQGIDRLLIRYEKTLDEQREIIKELRQSLADGSTIKDEAKQSKDTSDAETLFNELWEAYPRKEGKSAVGIAAKKRLLKVGKEQMLAAIENYKKTLETRGTEQKYILQGSTFFNTRYKDYLPGEFEQSKPAEQDILEW